MVFAAIGVRDEILSIPRLHRSRLDQMLVRGRLHARQQRHADECARGSLPGATPQAARHAELGRRALGSIKMMMVNDDGE
jgi:hypothetical protein